VIRRRLTYAIFHLRLLTLLLPVAAFAIAAYLRFLSGFFYPRTTDINPRPYLVLLLFTTIVWAGAAEHFGLCRPDQLFASAGKTRRLLAACASTYAGVLALVFFYHASAFPRAFIGISAVALFVLAGLARLAFRVFSQRDRRNGRHSVRVLIVGADDIASRAADRLVNGQVMPCLIVGFVRLPGQEVKIKDKGKPILQLDDASKLAFGNGIDDVVIAVPPDRFGHLPDILDRLKPLCVPMRVVLDFAEGVSLREQLFDFGGIPMLDLSVTPVDSVNYLILKRGFDFAFALFAILVTAPLMALIALAIKLTSPGPVIFAQDRVGLNGKLFRMYKFRTMMVAPQTESDTRWTTQNDGRRTKVGALLRHSNLDELPQFFNVLMGNMSVVGPRPERPFFVTKFLQEVAAYSSRHYLKAGITGWAQVNGWRGDTSIQTRIDHDLYYLRHYSMTFDLQIILLTLLRGLSSKNAY
jgi:Undecaprenyl-phosphate glucose phosphotransferase